MLEREWRRGQRNQSPISLLRIEVDGFDALGAQLGPSAADQCLLRIAHIIAAVAQRASDMPAHLEAQQFALILAEFSAEDALHLAEMIRLQVDGEHLHFGHKQMVTVSIGVADAVPSREKGCETLIRDAEAALETALTAGRNQVILADTHLQYALG